MYNQPSSRPKVFEPEAKVVRGFFLETANGTTTARVVTLANPRRFATKTGKTGAWMSTF